MTCFVFFVIIYFFKYSFDDVAGRSCYISHRWFSPAPAIGPNAANNQWKASTMPKLFAVFEWKLAPALMDQSNREKCSERSRIGCRTETVLPECVRIVQRRKARGWRRPEEKTQTEDRWSDQVYNRTGETSGVSVILDGWFINRLIAGSCLHSYGVQSLMIWVFFCFF